MIAVIVVVVIVGLSGSYLAITSANSVALSEEIARDQALQVAEAGVDEWIKAVEDFRAKHPGAVNGEVFGGVLGVGTTPAADPTKPAPNAATSASLLSADPAGEWEVMTSMSDQANPQPLNDGTGRLIGSFSVEPIDWANDGVDNDGNGTTDGADPGEPGQFTLAATGTASGTTVRIEVTVGPNWETPFMVGLFGDKKMKVEKDSLTDSFASHPDKDFSAAPVLYDATTAGDNGDVGSNGRVKIKKDTEVNGFVKSSGVREWKPGDKAPFNKKLIDIDKGTTVVGDVAAGHGTVRLKKDARVDGDVGTSDGNVKIDRDSFVGGNVDTANGDVEVKDGSHVVGHVSTGPDGTATIDGTAVVDGGVTAGDYGPDVPEIVFPPAPAGDGLDASLATLASATSNNNPTTTVTKGKKTETVAMTTLEVTSGTLTLPGGNYYFDKVAISKDAKVVFTGDVNLVVTGDMTLHDTAAFLAQGNANISVGNKLDAHHRSTLSIDGNTRIAVTQDLKLRANATFGVDATKTTTIDVGHHFDIKHEANVRFAGPTVLESEDRFRTDHKASLAFGDAVTVFAQESLEIKHTGLTQVEDATKAFFFAGGGSKKGKPKVKIEIPSDGKFFGGVYAPAARIDIRHHHHHHDATPVYNDATDDKEDLEDDKDDDDDDADEDKDDTKGDDDDEFDEDTDLDKSGKKKKEEAEEDDHLPQSHVADFMGAVIGWDVKVKKGIRFHYDESLGDLIGGSAADELVVIGWRRAIER